MPEKRLQRNRVARGLWILLVTVSRILTSFKFSDLELCNQLRYFAFLFDGEKAIVSSKKSRNNGTCYDVWTMCILIRSLIEAVTAIVAYNKGLLEDLTGCVEKYLDQCGRRWVNLKTLFSFMKV